MRKVLSLWLLATLVTACGRAATNATPTPTLAPVRVSSATSTPAGGVGTPTVVPTVARPTPAAPIQVTVTAPDGKPLAAFFYPPVIVTPVAGHKAPGVLLLHIWGGSHVDWEPFARQLQSQGMAALALDFRGYGVSPGPIDWTKGLDDTRAAWQALLARPEVDPQRSAIAGASVGGNLALVFGAGNPDVAAVIALSPQEEAFGYKPTGVLSNFGSRPVYLIASSEDTYSYNSVKAMAPHLAAGETFYYQNAGHGTAMFSNPDLATRLLAWLGVHIGDAKG